VSEEITADARLALTLLFDEVVTVEKVYVPHSRRQERQDRPYWFTRLNALRLGEDGDLGFDYQKIVLLDADVLPLRHYDHLFSLSTPAGVINEHKSHLLASDEQGNFVIPPSVAATGTWRWHHIYGQLCPHGHPIPREITDRVQQDPTNLGINASLLVLQPSLTEFERLKADLTRPEVRRLVGDLFDWPDMQYLTLRWSGQWTSVDLRFSGLNGYPNLATLFGTHYAGFKPWYFGRARSMARYSRHEDFRFWFQQYQAMMTAYPRLQKVKRLRTLQENIQKAKGPAAT
jgi:glycogenin glucosyltransferase